MSAHGGEPSVDYGARGRFGLLVPQANPTVEPEFRRLVPPDAELYVARLTSRAPEPRERLIDYAERLTDTLAQYDSLRLTAVAFACTGSSYLVGRERESRLLDAASSACGAPVVSAAAAILDALRHVRAQRLCIVSPYPAWLRDAAAAYWRAAGFDVVRTVDVAIDGGDTRGIYELQSADAATALASADLRDVDAVLLSGTGMPTLRLLESRAGTTPPVLAANACLAWRLRAHLAGGAAPHDSPLAPFTFPTERPEPR